MTVNIAVTKSELTSHPNRKPNTAALPTTNKTSWSRAMTAEPPNLMPFFMPPSEKPKRSARYRTISPELIKTPRTAA